MVVVSASDSRLRSAAVDIYRGLAVILMCLADFTSQMAFVPAWLKHGHTGTITVVDLVAPLFIVAMAIGYGPSYRRRMQVDGRRATLTHFLRRGLALMGAGLMFTFRGNYWGLWQTWGLAVLLVLPVMGLNGWKRLIVGLSVMGAYQALLSTAWREMERRSTWCEPRTTLAWAAMLVAATALADLAAGMGRARRWALGGAGLALVGGLCLVR